MRRGRKRQHSPHIPKHIDQAALPAAVYFDHRGSGVWYTLYLDEAGKQRRTNLAGRDATLSELHRIMEERAGIDRDSLTFLAEQFHKSDQFKRLAKKTQDDYCYSRDVLLGIPTKLGKPLGELAVRKFTPPLVQRVVDRIAEDGTPSKAAHALRYLRRLMQWGRNRGYVDVNPAQGIEAPKERKLRRLPEPTAMAALIQFAQQQGRLTRGEKGACAPYLWYVMEISYLCRLRGIETVTLTDANETPEGVLTNRRKGSRDNIVRWTPRLRAAWDAAKQVRTDIWEKKKMPVPIAAEQRRLIVAAHGGALQKTSLDTAWQRLVTQAIEKGVMTAEQRFGLHDFKRRGITDTEGTRADKQQASGHRSEGMLDVYDLSVPVVNPAAE
ncbi:integrase [Pseudomonas sp. HAR-UPW-AIA-41]|uniref:site-specific integrase n=1 Tax=Pseudomonas sp. HAR-UPW-AIA-41 TaxID=1985301 RepID=UPI000BB2E7B0|nr:integrase [Pseudomonas sp. HAR-UPW-AIA-41]PAV48465.1 integrase [Pseudomonas sp. HAR-UPW-AIA-41]